MTGPGLYDVWRALGGDPSRLDLLTTEGPERPLPGPLPTGELAVASVGAMLLAAGELLEARGGGRVPVAVDAAHVAWAVRSERLLRVDGASPGDPFDPLSAFLETADGWVRTHANYPHHREALLGVLGGGGGAEQVRARARSWSAEELEAAVVAAGGVAAAMRSPEQWQAHPQGRALGELPLLDLDPGPGHAPAALPPLDRGGPPAAGLRVLDLTRVIAGPVGTRMLAALGADVLRVDSPAMPEIPLQALEAGPGKRSTLLDLRDRRDRATFDGLLAAADVLVQGYRPGALAGLGLDPAELAARHPGLVTVTLSAWGHVGPWAGRRGFDSMVQAATGIAALTGEGGRPGVLPAQALDHATGYLVAAAALRGLAGRHTGGRALHGRLALARTARWLLDRPRATGPVQEADPAGWLTELPSPAGRVTLVTPPGVLAGRPLGWPHGPTGWGADAPEWR